MNTRLKVILLAMLSVVQVGVAGWSIARYESTLSSGAQYKVRVAPVDPADAFRGRYVAVRPEITMRKPIDTESARLLEAVENHTGKAYVVLGRDDEGFARAVRIVGERPPDVDYLPIHHVANVWTPNPDGKGGSEQTGYTLGFSFDRYYMNENAAAAAEQRYAQATRANADSAAWLTVRVRNGLGVIEELFVDGVPIDVPAPPRPAGAESPALVRPGIEVFLADLPAAVRGKRVGLITNHSAIDRARNLDIDLIARHGGVKLVALLAPEHGIRGDAAAGVRIADETDAKTGVPVYSLYTAEDRGPTPEMLKDVDALIYDLQEVGGRTWTYVSTMALAMQAAARNKIPFVVLDRPNPIGGEIVEGALLDPRFKSFVGMYPIPARHGMTVGELAGLFNSQHQIGADLIVVRAANWRRSQWMDQTGLPWVNPSPNLRSLEALKNYPGTVYFEGTNLTEGRGTDRPFEQIGASWLNAAAVASTMNQLALPGVRFEAMTMQVAPTAAKFPGQTIPGIRFVVTDAQAYRPVRSALILIDRIRTQHPREFTWGPSIDRLTGSDKARLAIDAGTLPALLEEWDREAATFSESRKRYLLYQ